MKTEEVSRVAERIKKYREYQGHDGYDIDSLIKDLNLDEKFCIENWKSCGLDELEVVELIIKQDVEYIKTIIGKIEQYDLKCYVRLIIATQDVAYMKQMIEKREEYGLGKNAITELAIATNDVEYIKEMIDDRETYGFDTYNMEDLVIATQDADYIKKIVENIEQYRIERMHAERLIKETHDSDYIKEVIKNKDNYGLFDYEIVNLVIATQDIDYIKETVEALGKEEVDSSDMRKLIVATQDVEYIEEWIERQAQLTIDIRDAGEDNKLIFQVYYKELIELIGASQDVAYIKDFINNREAYGYHYSEIGNFNKSIHLPKDMTFGIEIESEGAGSKLLRTLQSLDNGWKCLEDGSLIDEGVEIVSTKLRSSNQTSEEIGKVCGLLKDLKQTASERCGGHIHIGADYLMSVSAYKNLIEIYGNSEKLLYLMANEKGKVPRDIEYASPLSKKLEDAIKSEKINLQNEDELSQFLSEIKQIQSSGADEETSRYSGINFLNINSKNKNTIEFRIPNGTLEADTWIENINLFGGIVKAAQELSIIQQKKPEELTEDEKEKLSNFEKLKEEGTTEEEQLEALLTLVVKEDQKSIYRDRYRVNSELMQKEPELSEEIGEQIATEKIIMKRDIGKFAFAGNEPVSGEEYRQGSRILEEYMRENERIA